MLEVLAEAIRQEKEIKEIQTRKQEAGLSLRLHQNPLRADNYFQQSVRMKENVQLH